MNSDTRSTTAPAGQLWFRQATRDDGAVLLSVIQQAFAEYHGKLDPPSGAHSETAATLADLARREQAVLAGVGADPAGCVFFHYNPDETYLHRLAVKPWARRLSIGRALMYYVEAQAREAGSPRVRLGVRLQLPENQAYYARMGYRVLHHGSHPGYVEPTFAHMVKDVSEPPLRLIEVMPHDPDWARQYAAEARLLRLVFGDQLVAIHHIGSTSIPGIYAKPIIDMLPLVKDIDAVESFHPVMEAIGYKPYGEFGIPGRRYFTRGSHLRTHQAHIFEAGAPEVARHLIFRDYLIAHPEKAQQYSDLKQVVAQQNPHDIHGYMDGKDAFIKAVQAEALIWSANQKLLMSNQACCTGGIVQA